MPPRSQPLAAPPYRDPALDGLRGAAVLLVFLFHYGGGLRSHDFALRTLGYLTQAGWIGVDLFFALSGFLITGLLADAIFSGTTPDHPIARDSSPVTGRSAPRQSSHDHPKPHTLRNFYARRALRILPLYFAALLACAAAALLTGATLPQLKPLLLYVAFVQNLPPLLHPALQTPAPLPVFHLWSLAVEEQFYLLWPFILLAARTPRRALYFSLITFLVSCLFRFVLFAPHLLPWSTAISFATFLPTRVGALALGSALALYRRLSLQRKTLSPRPEREARSGEIPGTRHTRAGGTSLSTGTLLAAVTFSLVLILLTSLHTHTLLLNSRPAFLFTLPAADVLSAALIALALRPDILRSCLGTRPLAFLGRISYGFYVLHILLEPAYDHLGGLLTHAQSGLAYQAARLIIAFLITTAAAWLSFTLFERPFLRLKRRFPRQSESAV